MGLRRALSPRFQGGNAWPGRESRAVISCSCRGRPMCRTAILRAMHVAMEDHRSSDFPKLTLPLYEELKKIFKTKDGQVVIFPSSGTGAWEAAHHQYALAGRQGAASRASASSAISGASSPSGTASMSSCRTRSGAPAPIPTASRKRSAPTRTTRSRACSSSITRPRPASPSDVAAVRRALDAAKHPALLYVDGVSSIASIDFRIDDWGVDLAITGSQKGLMLPAGLGIRLREPEGARRMKDAKCTRAYFDLADQMRSQPIGYFPYTPALPLLYGLARGARHASRRRGSRTSSPAIAISPKARAPRSRRGASSSAPRSRNGIPTR